MNWLKANRLSVKDPLGSPTYDLSLRSSVDNKSKSNKNLDFTPQKIKSNPSFSLEKINSKTIDNNKGSVTNIIKRKDQFKLPTLKKSSVQNPEFVQQNKSTTFDINEIFYQSQIYRALKTSQNNYMASLSRQHFQQTIEALRITKNFKVSVPRKQIKLQKKSPHKKTIYLDLDQTLIHTDERSQNYSVKLTFPIETGGSVQAGVRIRPYCNQFLTQLAKFAQIIIFTASSSSYANVILDYLDPEKKFFSYRLYRNHCTLEKGFYVKDLRVVNRNLQDVAIVDNSAFSFLLQPENGIPILPFYHFNKDKELESLIVYLKHLVKCDDMRTEIKKTFFWDAYLKESGDIKRIFLKKIKKKSESQ